MVQFNPFTNGTVVFVCDSGPTDTNGGRLLQEKKPRMNSEKRKRFQILSYRTLNGPRHDFSSNFSHFILPFLMF